MLNAHKSKTDPETQPHYDFYKVTRAPLHFLLTCSSFDRERRAPIRLVTNVYNKNVRFIHYFNIEEL